MNNVGADSSPSGSQSRRWRTFLQIISVVVAVEIGLHSFIVREPVVTIVLAALWLAGFFWIRRGGRGGPILIGALSLIELLGTAFFSDEAAPGLTVPASLIILHVVLVSVALAAVVMTLRARTAATSH